MRVNGKTRRRRERRQVTFRRGFGGSPGEGGYVQSDGVTHRMALNGLVLALFEHNKLCFWCVYKRRRTSLCTYAWQHRQFCCGCILYIYMAPFFFWVFAARLPSQLPSAPLHFRMNMVYTIIMSCHLLGNKRTIMMFYLCFARVRVVALARQAMVACCFRCAVR